MVVGRGCWKQGSHDGRPSFGPGDIMTLISSGVTDRACIRVYYLPFVYSLQQVHPFVLILAHGLAEKRRWMRGKVICTLEKFLGSTMLRLVFILLSFNYCVSTTVIGMCAFIPPYSAVGTVSSRMYYTGVLPEPYCISKSTLTMWLIKGFHWGFPSWLTKSSYQGSSGPQP